MIFNNTHIFFKDDGCTSPRLFPEGDPRLKFEGTCQQGQMSHGTLTFKNGDTYTGEFDQNQISGFGTFTKKSGEKYDGDFVNGQRHGHGKLQFVKQNSQKLFKYDGSFANNQMRGYGKLTWKNGAVYEGNFEGNKRTGHGTMKFERNHPTGQVVYSGLWINDLFEGQGELKWKNGKKFNGVFKKGIINGHGTFNWPDGRKYVGQMVGQKSHGNGLMFYPANDVKSRVSYEGQWKNNNWQGNGVLILTNGDKYSGHFKDNQFDGKGTYTYINGNVFNGQWKEGKRKGFGVFTFSPKNKNSYSRYEGEWMNNRKNGFGKTFDSAEKIVRQGQWKDDVFVG